MYKILVVDDSALMRRIICDIINADSDFHVADVSADGEDAYNKIKTTSYDLIVLDMILPKMTGLEVLKRLSADKVPFNVILISSSLKEDADSTIKAIELGALDFVVKPIRSTPETREVFARDIMNAMKACIKTVSIRKGVFPKSEVPKTPAQPVEFKSSPEPAKTSNVSFSGADGSGKIKKIIALACSTGGPQALHTFVPMLPSNLPVPVVIVQHMPEGFTASLAARLNQISSINVKEAEDKEVFKPGLVYVTPGGKHMEIYENASHQPYCHLSDDPPVNSLKPCADVMYRSLTKSTLDEIICVVLTGMGSDGSEGIKNLKQYKKTYVISQEASTCVVYGMPKAVEQGGLSDEVVPLKSVANSIVKKLGG